MLGHLRFNYGPNRERYKRTDQVGSSTTTTLYLGGVEKIYYPDNTVEWKRTIAGVATVSQTFNGAGVQQNAKEHYLHYDHLGSVSIITDEEGLVAKDFYFDPWGASRTPDVNITQWQAALPFLKASKPITSRGFTGHEHVDEVGLIHMNGRIYDARLARFVQADPIIQDPLKVQSLNRYSYVWNNPLNATDPSGFSAVTGKEDDEDDWRAEKAPDVDEEDYDGLVILINEGDKGVELESLPGVGESGVSKNGFSSHVRTGMIMVGRSSSASGDRNGGNDSTSGSETRRAFDRNGQQREPLSQHSVCQGGCHGIDYSGHSYGTDHDLFPLYVAAMVVNLAAPAPKAFMFAKGPGTVYDSIKATQGVIRGTSIPKSFVLASKGGKFWVHPNATKHMAEYLTRNGLSYSTSVGSQAMLTSFRQAVNQATAQGFRSGEMVNVGRWELMFTTGRSGDVLPVIKHALYK